MLVKELIEELNKMNPESLVCYCADNQQKYYRDLLPITHVIKGTDRLDFLVMLSDYVEDNN